MPRSDRHVVLFFLLFSVPEILSSPEIHVARAVFSLLDCVPVRREFSNSKVKEIVFRLIVSVCSGHRRVSDELLPYN